MTTFIWIVGHSACGKDTFGKAFEKDPATFSSLVDIPCVKPQYLRNPRIPEIEEAAESHDAVICKWQCINFRRVTDLVKKRPYDFHAVVHLRCEVQSHREAFALKWPTHRFEDNYRFNLAVAEAYRTRVHLYVDVANLGRIAADHKTDARAYCVIGRTTNRRDHESREVLSVTNSDDDLMKQIVEALERE